ncbi:Pkinase-fungal domain-containing protein [Mycena sanguinolenta]|uniref:Pkinase-fungal domain-containing protein n=1 Tax=Mycena sanguinolenta TaxID=230812 RepID=A0A8H6YGL7_9AGAR|nr:Pkinase-fungal domain-containing protein [Mycena sanguinolenta]
MARRPKAKVLALQRYEKAASDERDAMLTSILPGREPPGASFSTPEPVFPSNSNSQILPTDPEAIEYPDKTLDSVAATAVIGNLSTEERKEQREMDARCCATYFAGRVVLSPLDEVLTRLGTPALVHKLAELKQVAHAQLNGTLKDAVFENLRKESIPWYEPADRMIDNRYWLSRLADAASQSTDSSPLALDYFPIPAEKLPEQKQHGYNKTRKYDAALRPSAAKVSTVFNILVNVEFTKTKPPNTTSNPLIGPSDCVAKYQQAIINAVDLLSFQPTRLFVPTLSFHGKKRRTKLFVSILNQERLEFAVVENCFNSDNLATVSALLHLFRIASLYQLGYNPLFIYNFSSPPATFSVGDAVPASVVLPGTPGIVRLNGKRLTRLRSTPFERSTLVLEGEFQSPNGEELEPVVIKASFISEARLWRERIIVEALHAADLQSASAYAPKLLASFAGYSSPPPSASEPASSPEHLPTSAPRHLEVMVFASPHGARKLKDLTSAEFLAAAEQLFQAILDAFRRRVLHRDISTNNVLVADNQLLLIDWEMGRHVSELSSKRDRVLVGTLNTMSVASLASRDPLPHDDVESAVYVLLKVLTQTFVPPVDQRSDWAEILDRYHWDDCAIPPSTLRDLRLGMWTNRNFETSLICDTLEILRSTGHDSRAQLIHSLMCLPLPMPRRSIDASDYEAVLLSLEQLVEQAVAAVRSADAETLFHSSAGERDELVTELEDSD